MGDNTEPFSKLEAGFSEMKIERRPISVHVEATNRFADASAHLIKDLDFDYDIHDDAVCPAIQGVLPSLQYNLHVKNSDNFASETEIRCFDHKDGQNTFSTLDAAGLDEILASLGPEDGGDATNPNSMLTGDFNFNTTPILTDPTAEPNTSERLLVFFVTLRPKKEGSFGSQASIQKDSAQKLFKTLDVNPEYLLNLVGRPDYWSPRTRWRRDAEDSLTAVDYFCQFPRWNVLAQGAPLSLYVTRCLKTRLTAYILSHKPADTSITALQQILKLVCRASGRPNLPASYLSNPFEIAVLLSTLSLEASKFHVGRFRRYMWQQINKVDDHLSGLEFGNRGHLTELTKSLQIISQQADSHLLNADVAIITARGTHDVQTKLHKHLSTPVSCRQAAEDAIEYVINSMEKQKLLFLNYKSRKDGTMSLVYNLVTQSDAANNIQLSRSMKRDSASMSAIAALTMVFLPGTFTSTSQLETWCIVDTQGLC
ncbi:hypothetical protein IF1G_06453 [Cordyceps javanica]|uniref:Uncharacterized protein n=1 Tax=Cordyceps javanica TaxID=43265 RepID=A0A545UY92_9HYPO|nr:hypothetical protein IF1G_06453 [Cordyceps javanica]TQW06308.1 hypothetical protein IF2G_05730 [Cordyceps javanica]